MFCCWYQLYILCDDLSSFLSGLVIHVLPCFSHHALAVFATLPRASRSSW
nr:MAG TPA: hypothetical protein [Caudoviricetes sp.]